MNVSNCTINDVAFVLDWVEILDKFGVITISIDTTENYLPAINMLNKSMLSGEQVSTIILIGNYKYEFLAMITHSGTGGIYYLQSTYEIKLTLI